MSFKSILAFGAVQESSATFLTISIETKKQRSNKDPAFVMFYDAGDIKRRQTWRQALILKYPGLCKDRLELSFCA
jgi:hypothetical protein